MRPVVLDCSVTVAWCFNDETTTYTDTVLNYIQKNSAVVPPLWLSEVTNALRSAIRARKLDIDGALLFLEKLSRLPIRVSALSSKEYFTSIFQLSVEENLSAYDATYLFLAKRHKYCLVTLDDALRVSARKHKLPKLN